MTVAEAKTMVRYLGGPLDGMVGFRAEVLDELSRGVWPRGHYRRARRARGEVVYVWRDTDPRG